MNYLTQNFDTIQNMALPTFAFRSGGRTSADFGRLFAIVLPYVYFGSAFLLLIYMVTGGLQLMLAKGDPKAVAGAWAKITNGVIGFIIVIMAYFITSLFAQIFGLSGFGGIFN